MPGKTDMIHKFQTNSATILQSLLNGKQSNEIHRVWACNPTAEAL